MALTDTINNLPPWALYGGAGVVAGGGYLLYRRRAAGASATPAAAAVPVQSALDVGAQTQQSGIMPYYLTDQSNGAGSTTMDQRRPPRTIPSSIPSATGATTTTTLPDIPPILSVNPPAPTAPAPAPPPAAMPAPAAAQNNNLPADLLAKIQAGGETIVSSLAAPNGGVWYLGSKGGVFAINAPFYGAAAGQNYFTGRKALQIVPNGKGYTIVDATGSRYDYPG